MGERETSELREQFIAVLGHDLRSPLASIAAGARMLTKEDQKEAAGEILGLMQKSVARMSALIDNVLDFARGRLGSGITLKRSPQSSRPILNRKKNRDNLRSDAGSKAWAWGYTSPPKSRVPTAEGST